MKNRTHRIELDDRLRIIHLSGRLTDDLNVFRHLEPDKELRFQPKSACEFVRHACLVALDEGRCSQKELTLRVAEKRMGRIILTVTPRVNERRIAGVVVDVEDISDRRTASERDQLKDKMANLGVLAANLAHELNNPLAAILNRVGSLVLQTASDPAVTPLREELRSIQDQLYSMSLITNALESFSGDSSKGFKYINVNSVVEKSIELAKLIASRSSIEFRLDLRDDLPYLLGNEITLEQALINILRNAIESLPHSGGLIRVSSSRDRKQSDCLKLVIRDNGCGIAAENINQIFEPFFKTKGANHFGLGLTVSYGIVLQHGGTLEVDSEAGKGTAVTILLPMGEPRGRKDRNGFDDTKQ
ncbi:hypothetical protein JW992_06850 [candidate division KSB1 bacterium]|nr:hypothetical protein [candidate division KSB1 bacterium]